MTDQKIVSQLDDQEYFVTEVTADESPLEPGVFLMPARCVDLRGPVLAAHQCAKLVDGGWDIQVDYRGLTYWTVDGEAHEILERGIEPPSGYLTEKPGPTLEEQAQALSAQARSLLTKSDTTIVRCYEHGVQVPEAWKEYRAELRAIVTSAVGVIPTRPEYPIGT